MDNSEGTRAHVIQLNSGDSVFEWDVPGNRLYLTKGARSVLALGDEPCLTLEEFAVHMRGDERLAMRGSLSNFLRGAGGATICFSHSFDGMTISTHMTVVDRRRDGMVTLVIGSIHVHSACLLDDLPEDLDKLHGHWRIKPLERLIRFDRRGMELLGASKPDIAEITVDQLQSNLHPEDAVRFLSLYEILFREGLWEGNLSDSFRYRIADGSYRRFAVNASVIERDDKGRVVEMIGSMQVVHPRAANSDESEFENGNALNAIAASEDGFWDWFVLENHFLCSPRYLDIMGYAKEEFPTTFDQVMELVHPDDQEKFGSILQRVVESPRFGKSFETACRMRRSDGEYAWLLVRGYITSRDVDGRALRAIALNTDISGIQNDWGRLEAQIRNDELTGLRSRSFLKMECERIEKSSMRPVSVIAVDLDGLKLVNDYLGHNAGDHLLKDTAILMRRVFRSTDCLARVGGDEFTVLVPTCSAENARALANRLSKELDRHNTINDSVPLLFSIGVGSAETGEHTLAQAISDADKEMLRNKHKKRPETLRILKDFIQSSGNVVVRLDESRYL